MEESVEKSVTRCLHSKCHPFYPTNQHHFLVGFLKEVLKQYPSYEISNHHPNLCPKGCSSYFPRQIEIRQVCDVFYNFISYILYKFIMLFSTPRTSKCLYFLL